MKKRLLFFTLFMLCVSIIYAQRRDITGTVLSADDNEPIVGATVTPKGRPTGGTLTDINGKFVLKNLQESDKIIIISFIGMITQELTIKDNMTVILETETHTLDEVVTIAYGTAKKAAFSGSATVVSAADISKRPVSNVANALAGRVSGLQMTQNTGQPGSAPSMIIRGLGSINAGTDPLIVLDGFIYEGGMSRLNPNDIENITVLKDASASALYGSKGANGVLMITTKKAQAGTAKVNVDIKLGVNKRGRIDYDFIKSPAEYYEAQYQTIYNYQVNSQNKTPAEAHILANTNMVTGKKEVGGLLYNVYTYPDNEYLIGTNGKINPNATLGRVVGDQYLYPDNWTDELYHNAFNQEYNVSVMGGTNLTQVYGSFGYKKEEGTVKGTDFERYNVRLKASHQMKKWLKLSGNASYAKDITNGATSNSSNSAFAVAANIAPIYPVYLRNADGNIRYDQNGRMYDYGSLEEGSIADRPYALTNAPFQDAKLNTNKYDSDQFVGNMAIDVDIIEGLRASLNAGIMTLNRDYTVTNNPYYGFNKQLNGEVTKYHYKYNTFSFQQMLNYSKTFNGLHNISLLAGHDYYTYRYRNIYAKKTGMFSYWGNQELDGAILTTPTMGSALTEYNKESFFTRGMYDYNNKYFFSASYVRDASSRFHPDNRWGNFYSFGASYLIDKEDWFTVDWVNFLKLKLSYGQQGNDDIGYYRYVDTYSIQNANNDLSLSFSNKGNKDISWETIGSLNLGVEFELFKNRIGGEVVYFNRKTSDMLYWFNVPPSLGYSGYYANIGDMKNNGIEVDLRFTPVRTRDIEWGVNLNMSYVRNRMTYIPEARKSTTIDGHDGYINGNWYIGEGLPLNTYYMKSYAGVNEEGLPLWYKNIKDGDGNITGRETTDSYTTADYYLCGSPYPDLYGGFGTTLNAFGIDFSLMFNYAIGADGYDTGYASLMGVPTTSGTGTNYHKDVWKAWSPDNQTSNIPRRQFNDQNINALSDRFIIDASYLALQNIQIGYTLPTKLTRSVGVSKLRVYFLCDNVYYWTKRKGYDPRFTVKGTISSNAGGDGATTYAPSRSFIAGINLEF